MINGRSFTKKKHNIKSIKLSISFIPPVAINSFLTKEQLHAALKILTQNKNRILRPRE